MKLYFKKSKLLIFVLILQLSLPGVSWSQQPQVAKLPETYQPYIIIDGILVPDEELLHLPKYRNDYAHGFADQSQVQLVDYAQVIQWKKKNAPTNEEASHDSYLVKARESLASGKKAYQQLDFEKALKNLTHSRNEFIFNLSHLRSNRDLLEAHLYLGMTFIALIKNPQDANEKQAAIEFEKVVMLDPQRELSPANFSPKVVQMFEKVKQRLIANNRITVKIDANVPKAKVYINGKLLGPTPIKARLIPGDYYFLFERKGMMPWSQLITLKDTVEHVTANMRGAAESSDWNSMFQIREGGDQQASMDELNSLARAVGGELIVLSNLERVDNNLRLLGQLYDVRTQEFSQVAIVDIGKDTSDFSKPIADFEPAAYDMAKALSNMVRPDGYLINSGQSLTGVDPMRIAPQQPQPVQQHDAPKAKLYEHWWFWAGVVAIGAGAYFGVRELGGTSGSSITIDNEGNF